MIGMLNRSHKSSKICKTEKKPAQTGTLHGVKSQYYCGATAWTTCQLRRRSFSKLLKCWNRDVRTTATAFWLFAFTIFLVVLTQRNLSRKETYRICGTETEHPYKQTEHPYKTYCMAEHEHRHTHLNMHKLKHHPGVDL
jgi:hypothetical protein